MTEYSHYLRWSKELAFSGIGTSALSSAPLLDLDDYASSPLSLRSRRSFDGISIGGSPYVAPVYETYGTGSGIYGGYNTGAWNTYGAAYNVAPSYIGTPMYTSVTPYGYGGYPIANVQTRNPAVVIHQPRSRRSWHSGYRPRSADGWGWRRYHRYGWWSYRQWCISIDVNISSLYDQPYSVRTIVIHYAQWTEFWAVKQRNVNNHFNIFSFLAYRGHLRNVSYWHSHTKVSQSGEAHRTGNRNTRFQPQLPFQNTCMI